MIRGERVKTLNGRETKNGRYVLYWMQASQRTEYNHALEYAVLKSNELNKPVVVYFGITDDFPEASERHYHFMLEGLKEVEASLEERGIKMVVWHKSPELGAVELSKGASLVVVDRGYLKIQRKWRNYSADFVKCPLVQVESDVVVPVEVASPKEEYSAAIFRPKIKKKLEYYLIPLKENYPKTGFFEPNFDSFDVQDTEKALSRLNIDRSVKKSRRFSRWDRRSQKSSP